MYMNMYVGTQRRLEEGIRSPDSGTPSSCELLDFSAGNRIPVLRKSSKYS